MMDCQGIEFLLSPLGGVAVMVGALLACAGLLVWARRPGDAGRRAVVLSASALGVCVAGLNLLLGATGVWQACTYRLPLIVLAAMYLLVPIVLAALLLMGYRWLVRHTRYPALVYGAALLVVVAPLLVIGDSLAIESGYLTFGAGYTVWMDRSSVWRFSRCPFSSTRLGDVDETGSIRAPDDGEFGSARDSSGSVRLTPPDSDGAMRPI
jgi:hypothetical protein